MKTTKVNYILDNIQKNDDGEYETVQSKWTVYMNDFRTISNSKLQNTLFKVWFHFGGFCSYLSSWAQRSSGHRL